MELIKEIFNTALFQPLFNLLVFLYNTIAYQDLGISIIIFTIITKLLLFPLTWKQLRSQKNLTKLQDLQPKLKEIQEKYKDDPKVQSQKVMEFYRENNVNPFGSCLPLLIQLPILIALFQVMRKGLNPEALENLYPFIQNPGELDSMAFGFLDLSKSMPIIAVIAGILMFLQSRMMMNRKNKTKQEGLAKKDKQEKDLTSDVQAMTSKQMTYLMPGMMVLIYWGLPAGLPFYFTFSTLFSIGQQYFMLKFDSKDDKIKDTTYSNPTKKKNKRKNKKKGHRRKKRNK